MASWLTGISLLLSDVVPDDFENHFISPLPGRILVFRTHDNKYAKMEIIYFYDSPDPQPLEGDYGGFYTFNYVCQLDGTTAFKRKNDNKVGAL